MTMLRRAALVGLGILLLSGTANAQFNFNQLKKKAAEIATEQAEKVLSGDTEEKPESVPDAAPQAATADLPRNADGSYAPVDRDFFLKQGRSVALGRALAAAKRVEPSCQPTSPITTTCGGSCMMLAQFIEETSPSSKNVTSTDTVGAARGCISSYNALGDIVQPTPAASSASSATPATPVAATPVVAASPAPVTASSDPFVGVCQSEYMMPKLYDCGCLGNAAPAVRSKWATEQSDPSGANAGLVNAKKQQVAGLEKELAKTTDPARRANLQRSIDSTNELLADLGSPDPMSMSDSELSLELATNTTCRTRTYVETDQYESCKKSSSVKSLSGDPEAYCQCVGTKVADDWTSGTIRTYSSNAVVGAAARARKACKS